MGLARLAWTVTLTSHIVDVPPPARSDVGLGRAALAPPAELQLIVLKWRIILEGSAMSDEFKPIAYVKEGCPYSEKLLNFLTEAHLTDRVDIVRCKVGTPTMEAVREKLASAIGEAPKFPTVELRPGEFRTESAELIGYFSQRYGTDAH
jgi:hypothetical protein